MNKTIDLNADMGESFGSYKMGNDEKLLPLISSANIACGFHAGDPNWMKHTVKTASEHNVEIGAHASYFDLRGFGRRSIPSSIHEIKNDIMYQMGALQAFSSSKSLQHLKPHGALYNDAVANENIASAICDVIEEFNPEMYLLALSGSKWVEIAINRNIKVAKEAFADRTLLKDGSLAPRYEKGAVLHDVDTVIENGIRIAKEGKALLKEGGTFDIEADSICIHGDTPNAVKMAEILRNQLTYEGIKIQPLSKTMNG